MNASTTFDKAAAIATTLATTYKAALVTADGTPGLVPDTSKADTDAMILARAFPSERKADVCRLLAEAMKDKERGTRNGVSVSTTLTKALESAKGFTTPELASLKAFWTLAVVADGVVNAKGK